MIILDMFYKQANRIVEVYQLFDNKTALIFDPYIADKQNGNGWNVVKMGQLIPLEYYNNNKNILITNTERSKIKKRLIIKSATWECTDGTSFSDIEVAIKHEKELMKKEDEVNVK